MTETAVLVLAFLVGIFALCTVVDRFKRRTAVMGPVGDPSGPPCSSCPMVYRIEGWTQRCRGCTHD